MGLLETLRDAAITARDATASFLGERAIARWLEPYGRMLNLSIDSKNSRIRIEILPKGESEPIAVNIEDYQITNVAGADFILIKKASASREWIDALLQDFAIGKSIALPEKYARIIKSVL